MRPSPRVSIARDWSPIGRYMSDVFSSAKADKAYRGHATRPTSGSGEPGTYFRLPMRPLVALLATLGLLAAAGSASAYPWPFKPFDKQHPIRGAFGDPRTVYENGILSDPFDGAGFFSFHQGVDIAAPNGTPIYAIADGTAHYLGAATLNLDTGKGVVFQFFHIVPVVGEGERVTVSKTVL